MFIFYPFRLFTRISRPHGTASTIQSIFYRHPVPTGRFQQQRNNNGDPMKKRMVLSVLASAVMGAVNGQDNPQTERAETPAPVAGQAAEDVKTQSFTWPLDLDEIVSTQNKLIARIDLYYFPNGPEIAENDPNFLDFEATRLKLVRDKRFIRAEAGKAIQQIGTAVPHVTAELPVSLQTPKNEKPKEETKK